MWLKPRLFLFLTPLLHQYLHRRRFLLFWPAQLPKLRPFPYYAFLKWVRGGPCVNMVQPWGYLRLSWSKLAKASLLFVSWKHVEAFGGGRALLRPPKVISRFFSKSVFSAEHCCVPGCSKAPPWALLWFLFTCRQVTLMQRTPEDTQMFDHMSWNENSPLTIYCVLCIWPPTPMRVQWAAVNPHHWLYVKTRPSGPAPLAFKTGSTCCSKKPKSQTLHWAAFSRRGVDFKQRLP